MVPIPKTKQISPYLVFFVIHAMQIGIGILGFQRDIAKTAGYDSWLSVIIGTICALISLFIMFKVLELGKDDLADTHYFVYGKIFGRLFNMITSLYFIGVAIAIIRTYIEILQVWLFEDLSVFWFSFSFLLLAIYIINGGFRTIVGIAFFSVILPFYLYFIFLFAVPYSDYSDFLPLLHHSFSKIIKASFQLSLSFIGYEALLIFSPFIEDRQKAKKWAYLGILMTGFIYLYITFISFGFYSEPQLSHIIWATPSLWKIVKFSFLWRFEYIGISTWFLVILPNICITLWCASRLMKKTIKITQRKALFLISFIVLIASSFFETRQQIITFLNLMGNIGIIFNFIYVPLLLLFIFIARKVKKAEN
ncbi:GerAB/ArcD/ProY family transporter [Bacillus sp. FJAT-50079]|uniref:GerAB/ArcD/ProY family transporter n=1 Tax=Bacillus sp. FJAT-50079 TaxID=2833577 RepID=UPI001BC9F556|nr:GerAB/ArcD/ProY family transporter [Bacillus sp. FJAT-50079]MBS4208485.1 GerAB/ArcD/ProY family transporter [Bacillus sp. FJAT-50079]